MRFGNRGRRRRSARQSHWRSRFWGWRRSPGGGGAYSATTTFASSIHSAPPRPGAPASDEVGRRDLSSCDRPGGSQPPNRDCGLPDPIHHLRLLLSGRRPERGVPLRPDALDDRERRSVDQRFLRLQHRRHHHLPRPYLFRQGARHVLYGVDSVDGFPNRAAASERASRAAVLGLCHLPDTVFSTGLLISALCVVMFRFARFIGASEGRAAGVALILGLATIAFPYATELTGEP